MWRQIINVLDTVDYIIFMGESTDMLDGSCSQNTLKNKRLEHQSYRQKRNFIDKESLSGEMHSRVWKPDIP
jgi:hypothetical protein